MCCTTILFIIGGGVVPSSSRLFQVAMEMTRPSHLGTFFFYGGKLIPFLFMGASPQTPGLAALEGPKIPSSTVILQYFL